MVVGGGVVVVSWNEVKKALSRWLSSSFFFSVPFLVAVHHVIMCNWPVVTLELYKQINRETCQPCRAVELNVCVV